MHSQKEYGVTPLERHLKHEYAPRVLPAIGSHKAVQNAALQSDYPLTSRLPRATDMPGIRENLNSLLLYYILILEALVKYIIQLAIPCIGRYLYHNKTFYLHFLRTFPKCT